MRIANPRQDLLTRERHPKQELLRLVIKDGSLTPDPTGLLPGRGFYIEPANIGKAIDSKAFARIVKRPLTKEEEDRLSSYGHK